MAAEPQPSPLRAEPQAYTSQPEPQPQPRSQGPSITIPLRPQRRRRGGRGLIVVFLFILFIFVAPLVIGAIAIFNTVDSATEAVRGGIKDGLESVPATPAKPAVPPKGVAGRSLVRKANFAAALAKLRGSELRLTHLRLAPERIDAQLLTRAGTLRSVQVQPGGSIRQLGPDSGEGFDQTQHDPVRAPERGRAAAPRPARRGQARRPGLDPAVPGADPLQRQDHLGRVLQARPLRARRRRRALPAQLSPSRTTRASRRGAPCARAGPSHPAGRR